MSELTLTSWFEFDEHRHLFMTEDGQPVAKLKFSQLSDGRDNAVNGFAAVKFVFGAEEEPEPIMEYQRVNLTNKVSANGWNKISGVLAQFGGWDWESLIQKAISATLSEWFEAAAKFAPLGAVELDDMDAPFLIEPLVSSTGMTMLFSPPGAGKSMIALGVAVSLTTGYPLFGAAPTKTGNILYVDFEDHETTHAIRRQAMLNAIGYTDEPEYAIIHYKVNGDLRQHLARIRGKARELDVVLIIVDSMGRARGNDPSDGNATIKLTDAMDTFGYPVLALDHVTKSVGEAVEKGDLSDPSAVTGIGSIFSTASARLGWFLRKMTTSTPMERKYTLYNNKHNTVAQQEPRSMTIDLENNEVGHLTSVGFKVWHGVTYEELQVQATEDIIASWMVMTHRTITTTVEAAKGTGLSRSAVNRGLAESGGFEPLPKIKNSTPYRISQPLWKKVGGIEESEEEESQ